MKRRLAVLFFYCMALYACNNSNKVPLSALDQDPHLTVNKTIAQLIAMVPSAGVRKISEHVVVAGIVTANDKSGNLYQQITIDDGTGGMAVLIDAYNLYAHFPVGRKIYVRCKGLSLGSYYRLPQLGFISGTAPVRVSGIPYPLFDSFIVKADTGHEVLVLNVQAADARAYKKELLNRLVRIEGLQVANTFADSIFALPAAISSATSVHLVDCDSNSIILRTSGFSTFAHMRTPKGNGTITALYTTYNATPQLLIRDTSDIQFHNERCR